VIEITELMSSTLVEYISNHGKRSPASPKVLARLIPLLAYTLKLMMRWDHFSNYSNEFMNVNGQKRSASPISEIFRLSCKVQVNTFSILIEKGFITYSHHNNFNTETKKSTRYII